MRIVPMVLLLAALPALGLARDPAATREKDKDKQARAAERKAEREDSLYERGNDALDDHDWQRAARCFREVADMHLEHADAALYWLAYADNKLGLRADALGAIAQLQRDFPKSRWNEDAKVLDVEVRQAIGQKIEPKHVIDSDAKLIVLSNLMETDPDEALRIGEEMLQSGTAAPKVKDHVLFVLTQSGDPRAVTIVTKTAKDSSRPDLQTKAVRYLAIAGGKAAQQALREVYASTNNVSVRRSVVKSYLITGDKDGLFAITKNETNPELRMVAVSELGAMGASNELAQLYNTEKQTEIRKRIVEAMFMTGNGGKLAEIARTDKDPDLRVIAARNYALVGGSPRVLISMYEAEAQQPVKHGIIEALAIMGDPEPLRELLKREKDPVMKQAIEQRLEDLE